MSKEIIKGIPELIEKGIITTETGERIVEFYKKKHETSPNKLLVIFGVIGAVLIGLGIILILAHNWDDLSRITKTILSFLPLITGQGLVGYAIWKKPDSAAWLESTASFLFFAIGASIALISQVYNIPGNLSDFLLTWMLLALPLIFLSKSSSVTIFALLGITYYAFTKISLSSHEIPYWYWIYFPAILLFYGYLLKKSPKSNALNFLHWLIPASLASTLILITTNPSSFMILVYIAIFGVYYWIGKTEFISGKNLLANGYLLIGSLGTVIMMIIFGFYDFWEGIYNANKEWQTIEIIVFIALFIAGIFLIYKNKLSQKTLFLNLTGITFILFPVIYFIGALEAPGIAAILDNIWLLLSGTAIIIQGAQKNNFAFMNYGLLIIAALIISRFFDFDLNYILRGLLFIGIGIGFFYGNYYLLKKK